VQKDYYLGTTSRARRCWVLLHGLGDAPSTFSTLSELLVNSGNHVLIPDLNRLWPELANGEPSPSRRLADGLIERIAVWRGDTRTPLYVCGHSVGAFVAIALAQKISAIAGIAVLEGSLRSTDALAVGRYLDEEGNDSGRRRLLASLMALPSRPRLLEYVTSVEATDPDFFRRLALEVVEQHEEARRQLSELRMPILYLAGAQSPGAGAAELAPIQSIDGGSVIVVKDAGHWVHIDAPADVARHLSEWADSGECGRSNGSC